MAQSSQRARLASLRLLWGRGVKEATAAAAEAPMLEKESPKYWGVCVCVGEMGRAADRLPGFWNPGLSPFPFFPLKAACVSAGKLQKHCWLSGGEESTPLSRRPLPTSLRVYFTFSGCLF